jgi:hypothetical protein
MHGTMEHAGESEVVKLTVFLCDAHFRSLLLALLSLWITERRKKKELTCNALANGVVRSGSNTSSSLKRSAQILARPLPATVLFAENPSGRRQRREFTATDAQQCCGGAVKVGASVQFLLSVSIVCCAFCAVCTTTEEGSNKFHQEVCAQLYRPCSDFTCNHVLAHAWILFYITPYLNFC